MSPSPSSINLLEQPTELSITVYLLGCWFTMGYNLATVRRKRCTGHVTQEGAQSLVVLNEPLFLHLHVLTDPSEPCPSGLTEALWQWHE